jgi:hypothetical protein
MSIRSEKFSTVTCLWKLVTVELCIGCDHVSNQQKAELVNDDFGIQSFQGCHGKILPWGQIMPKGQVCPEFFNFSNPAKFQYP